MTLERDNHELLFSYGTLQDESVQLKTFGRRLKGQADSLVGYRLTTVEIEDKDFAAENGAQQRNAHFTGDASDRIEGMVFIVTKQELEASDTYEPTDYKRRTSAIEVGRECVALCKDLTA